MVACDTYDQHFTSHIITHIVVSIAHVVIIHVTEIIIGKEKNWFLATPNLIYPKMGG